MSGFFSGQVRVPTRQTSSLLADPAQRRHVLDVEIGVRGFLKRLALRKYL